jgi:ribosome-binding factor A
MESAILQVVASTLLSDYTDPDLQGVTITQVSMTGDLQHATIYWTAAFVESGSDEALTDRDEKLVARSSTALNKAKGRFRTSVAKKLGSRLAPTLEFEFDRLNEQVSSIENLLAQAEKKDRDAAKLRANAQPAGGDAPYKS